MEWATQKEVLKKFRMLSARQAAIRRFFLYSGIALFVAAVAFVIPLFSVLLLILLSSAAVYVFAARELYDSVINRVRGEQGAVVTHWDAPQEKDADKDTPVYVTKSPVESSTIRFFRDPFISTVICCCFSAAIGIVFSRLILFHTGPRSVTVIASEFVLTYGFLYYYCGLALMKIGQMDFPEYPTSIRDKTLLRLYYSYTASQGWYFIGLYNGVKIGLPRLLRFLHLLIVGPTGEGKSSAHIILQLLFDADSPGSSLVPDAKSPELFGWVAGRWIAKGKKVVLFDPWHSDCCAINPIPGAEDEELLAIVETILKEREEMLKEDPFFRSRTKYLLYSMLKLVQSWDEPYCNLPAVFRAAESVDVLSELIDGSDPDVKKQFADFELLGNESQVNALTSIRDKMDIFMDENVRKAFSKDDFKLSMLFNEKDPCLLIVGAPIDKKQQGSRIASMVANHITNLAFKERRLMKTAVQKGQKSFVPNDLYLYGDEMRNLKISQLPDLVSIARDIKMQVICSVTDLDFLKYYGHDFGSLMGNLRTKIYLGGMDHDSCKYVSDALGTENKAGYDLIRDDARTTTRKEPLMEASDIHHMPQGEIIVFAPHARPFPATAVSVHNCAWAKKMVVAPPKEMKPYYQKWGFYSGELTDTILPKKGEHFDLTKLKGNKPASKIEHVLRLKDFEPVHKETGGGKYIRQKTESPNQTSLSSDESNIKIEEENNRIDDDMAGLS